MPLNSAQTYSAIGLLLDIAGVVFLLRELNMAQGVERGIMEMHNMLRMFALLQSDPRAFLKELNKKPGSQPNSFWDSFSDEEVAEIASEQKEIWQEMAAGMTESIRDTQNAAIARRRRFFIFACALLSMGFFLQLIGVLLSIQTRTA